VDVEGGIQGESGGRGREDAVRGGGIGDAVEEAGGGVSEGGVCRGRAEMLVGGERRAAVADDGVGDQVGAGGCDREQKEDGEEAGHGAMVPRLAAPVNVTVRGNLAEGCGCALSDLGTILLMSEMDRPTSAPE